MSKFVGFLNTMDSSLAESFLLFVGFIVFLIIVAFVICLCALSDVVAKSLECKNIQISKRLNFIEERIHFLDCSKVDVKLFLNLEKKLKEMENTYGTDN